MKAALRDKPSSFEKAVHKTMGTFDMVDRNDSILLAVSGGPDSMAMATVLIRMQTGHHLRLGIAHLNHCLRQEASDLDQQFVEEFARKHKLPFFTKNTDVHALAAREKKSLEDAGRTARMDFLETIARKHRFNKIALGHHKNDNAEQVLINLIRGSGSTGLSGIPPCRGSMIIRPLIQVFKSEIRAFLSARGQVFREDDSNLDTAFLRNKVRHRLIPMLEADFNPDVAQTLNRLSDVFRQEDEWIRNQAASTFKNLVVESGPGRLLLALPGFNNLHPAMKRRVARHAVQSVKNDLNRISLKHIDDILDLAQNAIKDKSLDLPDRIRVFITRAGICFKKEPVPLRELKR